MCYKMNSFSLHLRAFGSFLFSLVIALPIHAEPSPNPPPDLATAIDEVTFVETSHPGIRLSGYVDAGYTYNFISRTGGSAITSRAYANDTAPGGHFSLNAVKLVLEKPLPEENRLAAGFRVDLMMGEDAAAFGQNLGGSDSLYLQQAMVLIRLPYGNGIDLSVGKYQSLIGYESEDRPDNINITPGITTAADPGWLMGGFASYHFNDSVELALGVANGNGVDGIGLNPAGADHVAVTGFVHFTSPGGNAEWQTGFYVAPKNDPGFTNARDTPAFRAGNLAIWNTFGNWKPKFAKDKLLLAFNTSVAGFADQRFTDGTLPANGGSTLFGVALYAKYQVTDIISLAGRAEYVHTDNDRFLQISGPNFDPGSSLDLYTWTGTLGFALAENLLLRFEYRADWGNNVVATGATGGGGAFGDVAHTFASQIVFGF
jgi:hypothetical protein